MQALLVGVQEIKGKRSECSLIESSSYFKLEWSVGVISEIKLLSETIALSLRRISEAYPSNLKFMEVQVINESVQSSDFRP